MSRDRWLHMETNGQVRAWRVNDAEWDALLAIQTLEACESQSETIRLIIREAARARGLWPVGDDAAGRKRKVEGGG